MKPTILFLINSIELKRGGLTRASLKQASFFAELGYDTKMVTFNFNPNYPLIRKGLVDMNKIHPDVSVLNMFEELEGHNEYLVTEQPIYKPDLKELTEGLPYDKRANHNAYRVYDNGIYIKYISFRKDASLDFIDYFNQNRYRTKRVKYDPWGNIKSTSYMDLATNKPRQTTYCDTEGRVYLTQWSKPSSGESDRVITFKKDGSLSEVFVRNEYMHKVSWLNKLVNQINNDKVVIVSDTRSTDDILLNLNNKKAAKIWRLHSTHLDSPYHEDSDIAPRLDNQFEQINKFDATVFLTDEQKMDVQERFGQNDRFHVIPHFHESDTSFKQSLKSLVSGDSKNDKLGVVVSRLSTLKRIDHIIRAFEIVLQQVPDAELEIWGEGTEKDKLQKLISELKLGNNVRLMGYTHHPDQKYQEGLFSVLTSKSEGFALSVLESMYNKTPVISYNIKYGPTDMIINQENGYLVNNEDIHALADKMVAMFNSPDNAKEMGVQARKHIDKNFNKHIYKDKWFAVIDSVLKKKFS